MDCPSFLIYYADKVGKPLLAFTKKDWQQAAFIASIWLDEAVPVHKKPGRPRTHPQKNTIAWIANNGSPQTKKKIGRPQSTYGKDSRSIKEVSLIFDNLRSKAVRKHWPNNAPKTDLDAMKLTLQTIGHPTHYANSIMRAVRRYRSGQKR